MSKPLVAPEVPLRDELPNFVQARLDDLLLEGCWSLLLVPEEEITRWFVIFPDKLKELGRTPVVQHDDYMQRFAELTGGAVSLEDGQRFRIENFRSFNEFGDRYALQFFKEGAFSCDEAILRRRDNIRLINRLKPADTVTVKNEEDIARVILANGIGKDYLDHLCSDGLLDKDKRAALGDDSSEVLAVMHSINIPRKMAAIALADCLKVEYLEVGGVYFDKGITHLFGREWKRLRQVFPYIVDDEGRLLVAMADPSDKETIAELERISGHKAMVYCSAARDIEKMIIKAHKDD
ncbi:hypothetical protein IJT17_07885 [bacterium]|nr:hypothetical protein [bacterium]